ncbi:hypothetical protein DPEC_G00183090 [Dallia pectoralis]|uniref:Uncharacterized protein n=1 Tax=Dallia pectoralis TaxID=75939 RepID=A0ACC2GAS7_DALPE|nr:hypothetical protein DPEC_G00183090 [Dallia pectoralis]
MLLYRPDKFCRIILGCGVLHNVAHRHGIPLALLGKCTLERDPGGRRRGTLMTGFVTVLLLFILSRERKKKKSVQCICVFWGFQYNQHQNPNIEASHLFILLSCLAAITCMPMATAAVMNEIGKDNIMEFQKLLETLARTIQNSSASLYAPANNEIQGICIYKFMHCYLLELEVILYETFENHDQTLDAIYHLKGQLQKQQQFNSPSCLRCEEQTVVNSATFLNNFKLFLERINSTF